ncbi:MAG TPA: aldo/keto reductase [Ruminococcaceae bacterium]|nr:aldo/keto reductase [Oscillospiraceae bacterium]
MNYRTNPKNGDQLSMLGFGCMRFSDSLAGSFGIGGFDKQKAEDLIKAAIEKGVNYFDTAYVYGASEEVLGNTLSKYGVREKVYIATKLPLLMCRSKSDLDKYFNRQLERLQTDYIDYYLFHMLSDMAEWDKLCGWDVKTWIEEKKATGKIKEIGFSFHGSQGEFLSLLDAYDWDFVQIQYNYSDENFQAGVTGLKKAASKGMPVIIMEPLLGGKLANSLPKSAVECFHQSNPNITPVAWALQWLWNQPEVTVVLSGMNQMSQLDENLQTAETSEPGMLSQGELEVYREVKNIFSASNKIPCTGCHYCTPCPYGVDIPSCFTAYNTYCSISKNQGFLQYAMGTLLSSTPGYAGLCKKCGKCEKHCPQHIEIRNALSEVAREMEKTVFKISSFGMKAYNRLKSKK